MPRWVLIASAYVVVNVAAISLASAFAHSGVLSPPRALDVVEFFTWIGPLALAVALAVVLRRSSAKWYEWVLAALVVAVVYWGNSAFLYNVYAGI